MPIWTDGKIRAMRVSKAGPSKVICHAANVRFEVLLGWRDRDDFFPFTSMSSVIEIVSLNLCIPSLFRPKLRK